MVYEHVDKRVSFEGPDIVCGCLYDRYMVIHGDLENKTHVLDLDTMKWLKKHESLSTQSPDFREASSATVYNNQLYLFAGYGGKDYLASLYCLTLNNITDNSFTVFWERIHYDVIPSAQDYVQDDYRNPFFNKNYTNNKMILARWLHTICAVDSKLILFGGYCHRDLDDLWVMSLDKNDIDLPTFQQINVVGNKPCPRGGHRADVIGREMFIFGGYGNDSMLDDLWSLNIDNYSWRRIDYQSVPNTLKSKLPFFGALNDQYIIVMGGDKLNMSDREECSNSFLFDFETKKWERLDELSRVPDYFLPGCIYGTKVFVFHERKMKIVDLGSKMSHFMRDIKDMFNSQSS